MNLEVLLSTMHCDNLDFLSDINLDSDCIVINQFGSIPTGDYKYKNYTVKIFSFPEKGVGLSRNTALMRTTAEIAIFADNDVVFSDNYRNIILDNFKSNPTADVILFNVPSLNPPRPTALIKRASRLNKFNCLKYGAVNIAIKTECIKKKNIYFSLLFGGGAPYSSGEDSLFLLTCLKQKLKVFASPEIIGYVKQEESSWFSGYNKKYLFDKGVFWAAALGKKGYLYCLQDVIRHYKSWNLSISFLKAFHIMFLGWKSF